MLLTLLLKTKTSAHPGRIIGVSVDASGKQALYGAANPLKQHIAVKSQFQYLYFASAAGQLGRYVCGVSRLRRRSCIACRSSALAVAFADAAKAAGSKWCIRYSSTLWPLDFGSKAQADGVYQKALDAGQPAAHRRAVLAARWPASSAEEFAQLVELFTGKAAACLRTRPANRLPENLRRKNAILQRMFSNCTEHEMLLRKLEERDLAMNRSMISLGSCTMKLNATAEMIPVTWPEFTNVHPFAPREQVQGCLEMIHGLQEQLKAVTGSTPSVSSPLRRARRIHRHGDHPPLPRS